MGNRQKEKEEEAAAVVLFLFSGRDSRGGGGEGARGRESPVVPVGEQKEGGRERAGARRGNVLAKYICGAHTDGKKSLSTERVGERDGVESTLRSTCRYMVTGGPRKRQDMWQKGPASD